MATKRPSTPVRRLLVEELEARRLLDATVITYSEKSEFFGGVDAFAPLDVAINGLGVPGDLVLNPNGRVKHVGDLTPPLAFGRRPGTRFSVSSVNDDYGIIGTVDGVAVAGQHRSDLDISLYESTTKFGFTVRSGAHPQSVDSFFTVKLLDKGVQVGTTLETFSAEVGQEHFFGIQSSAGFDRIEIREAIGDVQSTLGGARDVELFATFHIPCYELVRNGAVSAHPKNEWMGLRFQPNLGFTIADAASVCGVHSFNYLQRLTGVPPGVDLWEIKNTEGFIPRVREETIFFVKYAGSDSIQPIRKRVGDLFANISPNGDLVDVRLIDVDRVTGEPDRSNDPQSESVFTKLSGPGGDVVSVAIDPILQTRNVRRMYVLSRVSDDALVEIRQFFGDDKAPVFSFITNNVLDIGKSYANELGSPGPFDGEPFLDERNLRFQDRPALPEGFARSGDTLSFETTLVGVDHENNIVADFREGYAWKTDSKSVTATGQLVYDPTDDLLSIVSGGVSVVGEADNVPPRANDDNGFGFIAAQAETFTTGDVLMNDWDVNVSDSVVVLSVDTSNTIGLVASNRDGTFRYDPNGQFATLRPGESATDKFSYVVSDGHGATDTALVTVTLVGVDDLYVSRLQSTSSGFVAEFNRELNTSMINLFEIDGSPADVTLRKADSRIVPGSLVVDAGRKKVSFIATGEPLSPGDYEVTFRTQRDGFTDSEGSVLVTGVYAAPGNRQILQDPFTTLTANLVVEGFRGDVADLDVTVEISYDNVPDLDVFLVSPSGVRVQLFSDVTDLRGVIFDDEATTEIAEASESVTGRFRPLGSLASFDGEDANGTWSLELVNDSGEFAFGLLRNWYLSLTSNEGFSYDFRVEPKSDAITIGIPDLVRGPGQAINLPGGTALGIPLRISNGAKVRQIEVTLSYDPSLLEFDGAAVAGGMPPNAIVTTRNETPGVLSLAFSSPTELPAGSNTFATLDARVPDADLQSIYGVQQVVDLHSVVIIDASSSAIPAIVDDAVHLVSYFGDVSANGRINASDAAQVARIAALLDRGFVATPLTDPGIVGDISGNGRVNAADASLLARFAALIDVPVIPPIPGGVVIATRGFVDVGPGFPRQTPALRQAARTVRPLHDLSFGQGKGLVPSSTGDESVGFQGSRALEEARWLTLEDLEDTIEAVLTSELLADRP